MINTTFEAVNFYKAAANTFDHLYERWQNERDYENFAEYVKPLKLIADRTGVLITKMTKRPFAVHIITKERTYVETRKFVVTRSARSYSYKRIG